MLLHAEKNFPIVKIIGAPQVRFRFTLSSLDFTVKDMISTLPLTSKVLSSVHF